MLKKPARSMKSTTRSLRLDSAEDFYAANSAEPCLPEIQIPTAVVYALDDPFVPSGSYQRIKWDENDLLIPLIVERGGHVGFHQVGDAPPWHHQCPRRFLQHRLRPSV